jgi:glyoxylase-like metal-dependent hydrolase (beta-lactamase superfamily II)
MPAGSSDVIEVAKTFRVKGIALTHTHPDHGAEYDSVKAALGAPVMCHPAEVIMPASRIDVQLGDGDEIQLGALSLSHPHAGPHAGKHLFPGRALPDCR